jgi:threonine dehydrogenase-like Zn-dependent dehydrogenase
MKPIEVPFSTMLTSEMTITTAVGYPTEMPEVISAMSRLKDKIRSLISHRVKFDDVLEGLKLAGRPDSAKVMVHFEEAGA